MGQKRKLNPIIGKNRFSISALLPLLGKLVSKYGIIRIITILIQVNLHYITPIGKSCSLSPEI